MSAGPNRHTISRDVTFDLRTDAGPTTPTGNRCDQNGNLEIDSVNGGGFAYANTMGRLQHGCKGSQCWDPSRDGGRCSATSGSGVWQQDVSVDAGYCLSSGNGFLSRSGAISGFQASSFGAHDKEVEFCPNDVIEIYFATTADHGGSHFMELIPQSKDQWDKALNEYNVPQCPDGSDEFPFPGSAAAYPIPCFDPYANQVDAATEAWQRGIFRISTPISFADDKDTRYFHMEGSQWVEVDGTVAENKTPTNWEARFKFTMPSADKLPYEFNTAAQFRWSWFGGANIIDGSVETVKGNAELFISCMPAILGDSCSQEPTPSPKPTPEPEPTPTAEPTPAPSGPLNCKAKDNNQGVDDFKCYDECADKQLHNSSSDYYWPCGGMDKDAFISGDYSAQESDFCRCEGGELPTPEPTVEPTPSPTPEPTDAPTPLPTVTPSPTPEPTPEPTVTPSPTPSPSPSPTPKPTDAPTPEPTDAPSPDAPAECWVRPEHWYDGDCKATCFPAGGPLNQWPCNTLDAPDDDMSADPCACGDASPTPAPGQQCHSSSASTSDEECYQTCVVEGYEWWPCGQSGVCECEESKRRNLGAIFI